MKLVWYYNNALGRPNKKKFIALEKSYVRVLNWCGYLPIFSWSNSKAPYILFHILVGTMGRLSYQLVFLGGINLHATFSTENLLFFFSRNRKSNQRTFVSDFQCCIKVLICLLHLCFTLIALITGAFIFQVAILAILFWSTFGFLWFYNQLACLCMFQGRLKRSSQPD